MSRKADWVLDAVSDFVVWLVIGIAVTALGYESYYTLLLTLMGTFYLIKVATKGSWIWKEVVWSLVTLALSLGVHDSIAALLAGLAALIGIVRLVASAF